MPSPPRPLTLDDFQPGSALRRRKTELRQARYPAIDFHTHLTFPNDAHYGVAVGERLNFLITPEAALDIMRQCNLRLLVDLTGGAGPELEAAVARFPAAHPGRFAVFTEPGWERAGEPGYARFQAEAIEQAYRAGARGLKVLKTLGLYLRDGGAPGPLVAVDDPRFDPMWEACAGLGIPAAIHTADPDAFFLPLDRFNERFEELSHHPDWSFHGAQWPEKRALLAARNRVFARHPRTRFVALHVANHPEDLDEVSALLDQFPNVSVDIAARINELGRQPRRARQFFDRYQDRILFGTDATPGQREMPQQIFGPELYRIYFRFLETEDEYFDYAPVAVPPQGRWRIYGLGLPDSILRKVYFENAARLLGVD